MNFNDQLILTENIITDMLTLKAPDNTVLKMWLMT